MSYWRFNRICKEEANTVFPTRMSRLNTVYDIILTECLEKTPKEGFLQLNQSYK